MLLEAADVQRSGRGRQQAGLRLADVGFWILIQRRHAHEVLRLESSEGNGQVVPLLQPGEASEISQRLAFLFEPGMLRGAALLGQGAVEDAIARIREGAAKWTRLGRTFNLPYGLAFLAEGLARHGDRAVALATLREGLETAGATGEHMWDAELHRLTGTVLLAENKLDEGQASLQQAIRIAQAQQAKSLELRAATSLAQLWGEQGRRAEARDLLAPVYGWFTEGFDTADLKAAAALLSELA